MLFVATEAISILQGIGYIEVVRNSLHVMGTSRMGTQGEVGAFQMFSACWAVPKLDCGSLDRAFTDAG